MQKDKTAVAALHFIVSDMSTVSQMHAFQIHLTERFTSLAMEIFQEVALIVKGYQEENDCLRSLLNNEINPRWNITNIDHKRLARMSTPVQEQIPELNIPEEKGAETKTKRSKMMHTQPRANVLQPFANTGKEEQTEVPVSSAIGESEQTGLSETSAVERSVPLPDIPRCKQTKESELLANDPIGQQTEYNRRFALERESASDSGVTMDCPKIDPKEQEFYTAKEFAQPSTSGEITNQDLLLQERLKMPLKKKGTLDDKPKRKTVMTTIALKKELIAKWERGTRVSDLAVQYNMAKSTVSTILKRKEAIKAADVAKGVKTLSSRRTDKVEEVEKVLLEWITHKQLRGDTVSETLICDKARELHNALTRDDPGRSAEEFKASKGWFVNFKERSGIHGVLRPREAARAGKEDAKRFEDEFQNVVDIQRFLP
ncbi:uncharacterized protein LOC109522690 [Hippocampus comes]|uniref:uncharacterized protein LOC109522690 n=1 Tax=Hippocampus comes TaxID=109280 RepID=UPI00094EF005|nr:PREDICTED: uncharacterized protein LOC109522690 [Hippocampus comes]